MTVFLFFRSMPTVFEKANPASNPGILSDVFVSLTFLTFAHLL